MRALTLDRQGFAGELVHDVQQLEVVSVSALIELKVDRPQVIGSLGAQTARREGAVAQALAFAPLAGDPQALLAPHPAGALDVQLPPIIEQQLVRAAVPPPRTRARDRPQLRAQLRVIADTTGSWRWVE
jgi:hypothetical protein